MNVQEFFEQSTLQCLRLRQTFTPQRHPKRTKALRETKDSLFHDGELRGGDYVASLFL